MTPHRRTCPFCNAGPGGWHSWEHGACPRCGSSVGHGHTGALQPKACGKGIVGLATRLLRGCLKASMRQAHLHHRCTACGATWETFPDVAVPIFQFEEAAHE